MKKDATEEMVAKILPGSIVYKFRRELLHNGRPHRMTKVTRLLTPVYGESYLYKCATALVECEDGKQREVILIENGMIMDITEFRESLKQIKIVVPGDDPPLTESVRSESP